MDSREVMMGFLDFLSFMEEEAAYWRQPMPAPSFPLSSSPPQTVSEPAPTSNSIARGGQRKRAYSADGYTHYSSSSTTIASSSSSAPPSTTSSFSSLGKDAASMPPPRPPAASFIPVVPSFANSLGFLSSPSNSDPSSPRRSTHRHKQHHADGYRQQRRRSAPSAPILTSSEPADGTILGRSVGSTSTPPAKNDSGPLFSPVSFPCAPFAMPSLPQLAGESGSGHESLSNSPSDGHTSAFRDKTATPPAHRSGLRARRRERRNTHADGEQSRSGIVMKNLTSDMEMEEPGESEESKHEPAKEKRPQPAFFEQQYDHVDTPFRQHGADSRVETMW